MSKPDPAPVLLAIACLIVMMFAAANAVLAIVDTDRSSAFVALGAWLVGAVLLALAYCSGRRR